MVEPSTGGTGSRSASGRCLAPIVLMLDGDDGITSMIRVVRLAKFLSRDSYEYLSEEDIRELKMRILDTLCCAIGAPARDFRARDPGHQGSHEAGS